MRLDRLCFDTDTIESEGAYRERIEIFPEGFLVLEAAEAGGAPGEPIMGFISSELWVRPETISAELFALGHSIKERQVRDGDELYVSSLAVDPSLRGYGFARLLFDGLIEGIRARRPRVRSVILLVGETWTDAKALYERSGFETIAVLEGFFDGRTAGASDGIVMRREIR